MSLITDDLKAQVGRKTPPYRLRMETEDLIRFAKMLGYTRPWYVDEEKARTSRYGSIIAAPTYLIVMRRLEHEAFAAVDIFPPYPGGVDGGSAWQYLSLVRAGDLITATARVTAFDERATKLGSTLFETIEIEYRNQLDQLAVRQKDTRIYFK